MKRRISKTIIFVLAGFVFLQSIVFAKTEAHISDLICGIDTNKVVTITGIHTGGAGRTIAVKIFESETEKLFYQNEYKTNEDSGAFKFAFKMEADDVSNKFDVLIKGSDTPLIESDFSFINEIEEKSCIDRLNNASNETQMKEALDKDQLGDYMGVDRTEESMFYTLRDKSSVYNALIGRGFKNAVEVSEAFNYAVIVQKINEATNGIKDIVLNNAFKLKLDNDVKEVYSKLSSEGVSFVEKYIILCAENKKFSLIYKEEKGTSQNLIGNSLNGQLMYRVYLADINDTDTTSRSALKGKLKKVFDKKYIFGTNVEKYFDLNDTNLYTVNTRLIDDMLFETYESLKSSIDTAVNGLYDTPSTDGGNGSNGSSYGNGGIIANDVTKEPEKEKKVFNDIDDVLWARESIEYLAKKGVVHGTEDGYFLPKNNIKREEFVKMLISALGLKDNSAEVNFTDLSNENWSYPYVASAVKCGIVSGVSETEFGMGMTLNREQMAAMIHRAIQYKQFSITQDKMVDFADSEIISAFARDAVSFLSGAGIVSGTGNDLFSPKEECSRAMVAKVIYGVLEKAELLN